MTRFSALTLRPPGSTATPIVAVDLGYSAKKRTCGVAWSGGEGKLELQFGEAIVRTGELLGRFDWKAVLVVEAVLSTYHQDNGNPDVRGDFEHGRGWYYGAGVLSFAAAVRFLSRIGCLIPKGTSIWLAEAFLSNKETASGHGEDAVNIRDSFWATEPVSLRKGVEPALAGIEGIPPVRVFRSREP